MKTRVEIDTNIYNKKAKDIFISKEIGLTKEVVERISKEYNTNITILKEPKKNKDELKKIS